MTIIQKIFTFFKKNNNYLSFINTKILRIEKLNPLILVSFLLIFSIVFFVTSNLINKKAVENSANLKEIANSNEFSNLTKFLLSKISSPYTEINYEIKSNDTVEKILRNFNIKENDIKDISAKLKQKKLAQIYSGRKLNLITKKLENGTSTVINLVYPINNTTSIEIRKIQKDFSIEKYPPAI